MMGWNRENSAIGKKLGEMRAFWIYFAGLVLAWGLAWGCLMLAPELGLLVFLCMAYLLPVLYLVMAMICYQIGKSVQRRGLGGLGFRIGFSVFAAISTTLICPVFFDLIDLIRWHTFSPHYTGLLFAWSPDNILLYSQAGVTFLFCWIGQEVERYDRVHQERTCGADAE